MSAEICHIAEYDDTVLLLLATLVIFLQIYERNIHTKRPNGPLSNREKREIRRETWLARRLKQVSSLNQRAIY